MAIEKQLNVRSTQKHDTETNWNKAVNFVPKDGEIIFYDEDSSHPKKRMKVGNGVDKVASLLFCGPSLNGEQLNQISFTNENPSRTDTLYMSSDLIGYDDLDSSLQNKIDEKQPSGTIVTSGGSSLTTLNIDNYIEKKLNDVAGYKVYGYTKTEQTQLSVADAATAWSIPRRGTNGVLKVANPSASQDAVNLYYLTTNYVQSIEPQGERTSRVYAYDGNSTTNTTIEVVDYPDSGSLYDSIVRRDSNGTMYGYNLSDLTSLDASAIPNVNTVINGIKSLAVTYPTNQIPYKGQVLAYSELDPDTNAPIVKWKSITTLHHYDFYGAINDTSGTPYSGEVFSTVELDSSGTNYEDIFNNAVYARIDYAGSNYDIASFIEPGTDADHENGMISIYTSYPRSQVQDLDLSTFDIR